MNVIKKVVLQLFFSDVLKELGELKLTASRLSSDKVYLQDTNKSLDNLLSSYGRQLILAKEEQKRTTDRLADSEKVVSQLNHEIAQFYDQPFSKFLNANGDSMCITIKYNKE